MLGFAMRAGKLTIGTDAVCQELRKKPVKVKLVLLSESASAGTKKKITTKCEFYNAPLREIAIIAEELGDLLGKTYAPAVVAVCDEGFAKEIAAACDSRESETLK